MQISDQQIADFQEIVWHYYNANKRPMPWREDTSDYAVFVSEIMLQQTQVARVIDKFKEFTSECTSFATLAAAPQSTVLRLWSGLGYNRRALFLHAAAKKVVVEFDGVLPNDQAALESLPGVGPNTAGALRAYIFNDPVCFVETNIRAVYIAHFFAEAEGAIDDAEILDVVRQTLPDDSIREWYWALMDYGVYIKKKHKNPARRSKVHAKQSPFEGSKRQIRGQILKILAQKDTDLQELENVIQDERLQEVLGDLTAEHMIFLDGAANRYSLDAKVD